jgi:hypothetical protein
MEIITIKEIQSNFRNDYPQLFEIKDVKLDVCWRSTEDIGEDLRATLPEYTTEDTVIDPSLYYLSLGVPLIFDQRLIPLTYQGFRVDVVIYGDTESEWDFGERETISYKESADPQKYIDFVKRCEKEIKEKLKSPNMSFDEMLDAICCGDYKKYKAHYDRAINENDETEFNYKTFISAWINFLLYSPDKEKKNETILETLTNDFRDNKRSQVILGKQIYKEEDSPLGNFLKLFYNLPLEYRTEYEKFDLVIARPNYFKFKEIPEGTLKENYGFYPKEFAFIIEHENDYKSCWQEMIKLTTIKARYKVLITYNRPNENGKDHYHILELLKSNFSDIIKQSNQRYSENDKTRYVLVVGQKVYTEPKDYLIWNCFLFDNNGICENEYKYMKEWLNNILMC